MCVCVGGGGGGPGQQPGLLVWLLYGLLFVGWLLRLMGRHAAAS